MKKFFHENGLSLALFGFFLVFVLGQSISGYYNYNETQQQEKQPTVSYGKYLATGDFVESIFENWESEFLQMGAYVLLTAYLYQKGSSESKRPDQEEEVDKDPHAEQGKQDAPGPVKKGGPALTLYQNSLAIALFSLFALSFVLHMAGGASAYCQEQMVYGQACSSTIGYLATPRFWFESFQNWQSEFLSMGLFIVLTIVLRQKGSPESKPVASPHSETGEH